MDKSDELSDKRKNDYPIANKGVLLDFIFQISPAAIMIADARGNIKFINQRAADMFGYDLNELADTSYFSLVHPDEKELSFYNVKRFQNKEINGVNTERHFIRKNGSDFWGFLSAAAHYLNGQFDCFVGIIQDITELKRAQNELDKTIKINKTILDCMPIGIIITDAHGNIIEANPSIEKLFGLPLQKIKKRKIDDELWEGITHDGRKLDPSKAPCLIALKEKKTVEDNRIGIVKQDGSMTWVNVAATPIPIDGYGIIGVYSDITNQKKVEDYVKNLLDEKERLLTEVHHRLKNNMTTLMSLISLYMSDMKNRTAIECLTDVKHQIQAMAILYDQLYRSKSINEILIDDYLSSLINLLIKSFPHIKNIKIDLSVDRVSLPNNVASTIGIIVNELITNSFKYAFPGELYPDDIEKIISVHFKSEDAGGVRLCTLTIADNGVGIPESSGIENPKTFGLDLVVMLVEQLEGTIKLQKSNPTKFTIVFYA